MMRSLKLSLKEIAKYPSAIVGLVMISLLVFVAIYALVTMPYGEAVRLWRGSEADWYNSPRNAPPIWYNWFSDVKQPETIHIHEDFEGYTKTVDVGEDGLPVILIEYNFEFTADDFPQEVSLFLTSEFESKKPFANVMWFTPDGREIEISELGVGVKENYIFGQDKRLLRRLDKLAPAVGLFMDPNSDPENPVPLKGTYRVTVAGRTFEENTDLNGELVVYGQVHGWGGTDHMRRDLMVPLLWGAPVALMFGLLAAVGIQVLTIVIAAVGVWFGGVLDALIQRVTEVNLALPFLSILIMIGTFYDRSIWTMLGATVVLSIFGGAIKGYRAIFMQVKASTYIEAARAYGAGNLRIIFLYLIPRIIPLIIPGLVLSVPTFVFLEATLAVLTLGDPELPTWGKVINDAATYGATYNGFYYWILEPAVLLIITGFGFAMLGYSLDRIFNPRLREI
ncbi:ABC transporter permease [Chloroflexota bacterium]